MALLLARCDVFSAIPITLAFGKVPETVVNNSFKLINSLRSGILIFLDFLMSSCLLYDKELNE